MATTNYSVFINRSPAEVGYVYVQNDTTRARMIMLNNGKYGR